MEPLLPESGRGPLAELTCDILREAGALSREIPSESVRAKLKQLTRTMNSYYSNLIEGHKTLPKDIESALKDDFSKAPEKKNNQHLSRAHIEVEALMEERINGNNLDLHSPEFLSWIHAEFYRRLPEELRWAETTTGKKYAIEPGQIRNFNVDVGHHTPPDYKALPAFLARFSEFYSSPILQTDQLIAMAAAHHRLAWIHPFGDGNGRVVRLYSHALLIKNRIDGLGLWTLSRGLARSRENYYHNLQAADRRRDNDYDGRGSLSEAGLSEFCRYFLATMLDQIQFMSHLLELRGLMERIELYVRREALPTKKHREEIVRLLRALLIEGEIPRTRVQEIIGKKETITRDVIKLALAHHLIETRSERGKLSIAFPAKVLESYFPKLFVDLPANP